MIFYRTNFSRYHHCIGMTRDGGIRTEDEKKGIVRIENKESALFF